MKMVRTIRTPVRTAARGQINDGNRKRKLQYWVGQSVYSSPITKMEVKKLISMHYLSKTWWRTALSSSAAALKLWEQSF